MVSAYNKDHYKYIPREWQHGLNTLIIYHFQEDWFEEAWEEYREYVLSLRTKHYLIKSPSYSFNKYIYKGGEDNGSSINRKERRTIKQNGRRRQSKNDSK